MAQISTGPALPACHSGCLHSGVHRSAWVGWPGSACVHGSGLGLWMQVPACLPALGLYRFSRFSYSLPHLPEFLFLRSGFIFIRFWNGVPPPGFHLPGVEFHVSATCLPACHACFLHSTAFLWVTCSACCSGFSRFRSACYTWDGFLPYIGPGFLGSLYRFSAIYRFLAALLFLCLWSIDFTALPASFLDFLIYRTLSYWVLDFSAVRLDFCCMLRFDFCCRFSFHLPAGISLGWNKISWILLPFWVCQIHCILLYNLLYFHLPAIDSAIYTCLFHS